jgi:hypothetical protein
MKLKKRFRTNDFVATTRFIMRLREVASSNPDARLSAIFFGGRLILLPPSFQYVAQLLLLMFMELPFPSDLVMNYIQQKINEFEKAE